MVHAYSIPGQPGWIKSSYSGTADADCIAAKPSTDQVQLGDTKKGLTEPLTLSYATFRAFLSFIRS